MDVKLMMMMMMMMMIEYSDSAIYIQKILS